jgi:hypothetical protein
MINTPLWELEENLVRLHVDLRNTIRAIDSFGDNPEGSFLTSKQRLCVDAQILTSNLHKARKAYAKALIAANPQILD